MTVMTAVNLLHLKMSLSKIQCSLTITFMNLLGHLLMEDSHQTDFLLIDKRWHSNVLDLELLRAPDCNSGYQPVAAKVRERPVVNKQRSHRFHMERFNLKKLNKAGGKQKYHVEVSNRFAVLEG
jgi:hypothetical protein